MIRKTRCDQKLVDQLLKIGVEYKKKGEIQEIVNGKTMCANDFYEGKYFIQQNIKYLFNTNLKSKKDKAALMVHSVSSLQIANLNI